MSDARPVLVFDMDGVLVDVSESYRETIRRTVFHFSGQEISRELIQDYKNAGGWNNDWALCQKILIDLGTEIPYDTVVQEFQRIFFGAGNDGLVLRERWMPHDGLLERLCGQYAMAIFTGRLRSEVAFTLGRFVPALKWSDIVSDEDVRQPKPAPDGLLMIAGRHPGAPVKYVGDTVDDARSARAAGVPFYGVVHAHNPRREEAVRVLEVEGAIRVIENINELEAVL
jgi:HAD superfamily phosphatase